MPSPGNAQLEECLRRVSEAEQCLAQVATAQLALQAARRALQGVAGDNGQKPTGAADTGNQELVTYAPAAPAVNMSSLDWKKQLNDNQQKILASLEGGIAENAGKQLGIPQNDVIMCFKMFCDLDIDASGKINALEMKEYLVKAFGANVSDLPEFQGKIEELMMEHDKNADSQLDFEEFLFLYANMPERRVAHLSARVHYEEDRLSDEFRVHAVGVSAGLVMDYCRKEMKEERSFMAIPSIFGMFVFFVIAVSLHRRNNVVSSIEEAFRFDIEENANFAFSGPIPFENGRMGHKSMYDVNSFADFWSWLDLGLVPLFFPESWDVSEMRANTGARCTSAFDALSGSGWAFNESGWSTTFLASHNPSFQSDIQPLCSGGLDDPDAPDKFFKKPPYLFFNSIVAGMRLTQEREDWMECIDSDLIGHAYDSKCVETDRWLLPDHDTALYTRKDFVNRSGGETQFFLSRTTQSDVRSHIRRLENSAWLDQQTSKVEILFTTYNPHNDIFVSVYINFFVNSGGHIHKVIKPVAIWMTPYETVFQYIADSLWAFFVVKLLIEESVGIFGKMRKFGCIGGIKFHFSKFDAITNFVSILYSFGLLAMWLAFLSRVSEVKDYLKRADVEMQGSWPDARERIDFFEAVASMNLDNQRMQTLLGFYPFAIGARFFTAFSGQPRLAVVTDTLKKAWNDILHFGIVLTAILFCYGVSASLLFGREVEEHETLGRCFVSVVRTLLGDADYVALSEVGRSYAMMWYVSFMVLLNLVMLNMLLAIIMDVYSEVKGSLDEDAETVFSQSYEIYRRWRQKRLGHRLGLDTVLRALELQGSSLLNEKSGEFKLLTVVSFMDIVPDLTTKQAQRVLTNSEDMIDLPPAKSMAAELRAVDLRVQHLQHSISSLTGLDEMLANKFDQALNPNATLQQHQLATKDFQGRFQEGIDRMHMKFDALVQQFSDMCGRLEAKMGSTESRAAKLEPLVPMIDQLKAQRDASRDRSQQPAFCNVTAAPSQKLGA